MTTSDRDRDAYRKEFSEISRPLIQELNALGYEINTVDDLRDLGRPWQSALPVLLRWLPRVKHPGVKEAIVRDISVPWVGNRATPVLIDEFRKAQPGPGLAWAIGNALSIVGIEGFEHRIIELSKDRASGMARQMIVLSLGRIHTPEAEDAAMEALEDETVKLHAIFALGDIGTARAIPKLEPFLTDKVSGCRKEAQKAIRKIKSKFR